MTSCFLAVFIVLVIGAVVSLYDRDHTFNLAKGETQEAAVERILRSRLQRGQDQVQHEQDQHERRCRRLSRLRIRVTTLVSKPFHLSRRHRTKNDYSLNGHHEAESPTSTTLVVSDDVSGSLNCHSERIRRLSLNSNSLDRAMSGVRSPRTVSATYTSDISSQTRPSSSSMCSTCSSCDSEQDCYRSSDTDQGEAETPMTAQERELAQRFITQQIFSIQVRLAAWREIKSKAALIRQASNGDTSTPASSGYHPSSPVIPTISPVVPRRLSTIAHHARRVSSSLTSPTSPLAFDTSREVDPPAYILPRSAGTSDWSSGADTGTVDSKQLQLPPTEQPPSAPYPAVPPVTNAHVATDEKQVLTALHAASSVPFHPGPRALPSAPTLANSQGLQLQSVGQSSGKGKAVDELRPKEHLPPPPEQIPPSLSPFAQSGGLPVPVPDHPTTEEEDARLAVLSSAPSDPFPSDSATLQRATPSTMLASAPWLDDFDVFRRVASPSSALAAPSFERATTSLPAFPPASALAPSLSSTDLTTDLTLPVPTVSVPSTDLSLPTDSSLTDP